MHANDDSTHQVGFGKPPEHSQFRKGVSGNPGGRPKGSRNFFRVLQGILQETVVVQENGKRRRMSKAEAMLRNLVNRAVSGDVGTTLRIAALFPQEIEATDVPQTFDPIQTKDGVFVPQVILYDRLLRSLDYHSGVKLADGQVSYIVITEKQVGELAAKIRNIFGFQPTNEQAVEMANTSLLVKEADERAQMNP